MKTAVLHLHCEDRKGIVYNVSRFIFERGGNIITSQQHHEEFDNRFFMRVFFDLAGMETDRETLITDLGRLADQFGMETKLTFSDQRKRMAIMVSRYDHCLYDLFHRARYGELNADIAVVVSNHPDLAGVAESFGTPFYHVAVEKGRKESAERRQLELFKKHDVDFIVLARYMQILTPVLLDAYPYRVVNVHHGFLPAFRGAKPYHKAYELGVKLIGATSHYVTEELDAGPIIEQETIRVNHSHSVRDMLALGRDIERRVLSKAVRAYAEDRIAVYKNRTIVFD